MILALCASPAGAAVEADRPYVYISPFYHPKSNTNATIHFTNGDDADQSLNIRRYNAIGGLLGSTLVTVQEKATIIAFAGGNSGAQMHLEIWADSPAILVELFYTDTASVTQVVRPPDWRVLGPAERVVPDAVAGLEATMGEIRPPILALDGDFDAIGNKVDAVQSSVSGLSSPIAELTPKVDALQSSLGALQPTMDSLAAENAALKKDVAGLRTQLRRLRALIVKRLPAKPRRRR